MNGKRTIRHSQGLVLFFEKKNQETVSFKKRRDIERNSLVVPNRKKKKSRKKCKKEVNYTKSE